MHIPGPYSDDTWYLLLRAQREEARKSPKRNSLPQVLWEAGLTLLVPLCGAIGLGLLLRAFNVS
jgi:hypothetical protein